MSRLWDKGAPLDERVLAFTAGDDFALDERLVKYDVRASIAHAEMLNAARLLSDSDLASIRDGLAALAGLPGAQGKANAVALQADGKIVVAGSFTPGLSGGIVLARYLADGSLDAAFGNGGITYIDGVDSTSTAAGIEISGDGRIYVAINDGFSFTVARRNADGSADPAEIRLLPDRTPPVAATRHERSIVRAHRGAEPADIYLVRSRRAPDGNLLEISDVYNLSDTSAADERSLVVSGERAAWTIAANVLLNLDEAVTRM